MTTSDILLAILTLAAFVFIVGSAWRGIAGEIEYRKWEGRDDDRTK